MGSPDKVAGTEIPRWDCCCWPGRPEARRRDAGPGSWLAVGDTGSWLAVGDTGSRLVVGDTDLQREKKAFSIFSIFFIPIQEDILNCGWQVLPHKIWHKKTFQSNQ